LRHPGQPLAAFFLPELSLVSIVTILPDLNNKRLLYSVSQHSPSTPARLTAPATVKLPRFVLGVLALIYIVAGLFGRDPWKIDDVAGLAMMLSALHEGGTAWLVPHVGPMELAQDGPLVMWTGAGLIRLLGHWLGDITASRINTIAWFSLTLLCVWYGTYLLGRRNEAQPLALPFGGEPTVKDYGRLLADAAVLLMLATVGLLLRVHETSVLPAMIACQALALCAMARMLDKPLLGALMLGLALAGAFLTRGGPGLAPVLLAVPLAFQPRSALWSRRKWLLVTIVLAAALILAWWIPASLADPQWTNAWLHWNSMNFGFPDYNVALRPLRDLPWFLWPVWPLAGLALWQWRRWMTAPHIWIPLSVALGLVLVLPMMEETGEPEYVLLIAPLSVLAAFALPTMRRAVVNTIDWFALMCFSVTIVCVWVGWFALYFGIPHQIQLNIQRLTTGYEPHIAWWTVIVSGIVTLIWTALVYWRIRLHPSVLWRGVMLCAAGITITWTLLVLLWMPAVDYVRSYRPMSGAIQAALARIPLTEGQTACVRAQGLSLGPRASLYVFDDIIFTYDSNCPYVLQQTTLEQLENGSAGYSDGVKVLWEGSRGADRYDRYRLLRVPTK